MSSIPEDTWQYCNECFNPIDPLALGICRQEACRAVCHMDCMDGNRTCTSCVTEANAISEAKMVRAARVQECEEGIRRSRVAQQGDELLYAPLIYSTCFDHSKEKISDFKSNLKLDNNKVQKFWKRHKDSGAVALDLPKVFFDGYKESNMQFFAYSKKQDGNLKPNQVIRLYKGSKRKAEDIGDYSLLVEVSDIFEITVDEAFKSSPPRGWSMLVKEESWEFLFPAVVKKWRKLMDRFMLGDTLHFVHVKPSTLSLPLTHRGLVFRTSEPFIASTSQAKFSGQFGQEITFFHLTAEERKVWLQRVIYRLKMTTNSTTMIQMPVRAFIGGKPTSATAGFFGGKIEFPKLFSRLVGQSCPVLEKWRLEGLPSPAHYMTHKVGENRGTFLNQDERRGAIANLIKTREIGIKKILYELGATSTMHMLSLWPSECVIEGILKFFPYSDRVRNLVAALKQLFESPLMLPRDVLLDMMCLELISNRKNIVKEGRIWRYVSVRQWDQLVHMDIGESDVFALERYTNQVIESFAKFFLKKCLSLVFIATNEIELFFNMDWHDWRKIPFVSGQRHLDMDPKVICPRVAGEDSRDDAHQILKHLLEDFTKMQAEIHREFISASCAGQPYAQIYKAQATVYRPIAPNRTQRQTQFQHWRREVVCNADLDNVSYLVTAMRETSLVEHTWFNDWYHQSGPLPDKRGWKPETRGFYLDDPVTRQSLAEDLPPDGTRDCLKFLMPILYSGEKLLTPTVTYEDQGQFLPFLATNWPRPDGDVKQEEVWEKGYEERVLEEPIEGWRAERRGQEVCRHIEKACAHEQPTPLLSFKSLVRMEKPSEGLNFSPEAEITQTKDVFDPFLNPQGWRNAHEEEEECQDPFVVKPMRLPDLELEGNILPEKREVTEIEVEKKPSVEETSKKQWVEFCKQDEINAKKEESEKALETEKPLTFNFGPDFGKTLKKTQPLSLFNFPTIPALPVVDSALEENVFSSPSSGEKMLKLSQTSAESPTRGSYDDIQGSQLANTIPGDEELDMKHDGLQDKSPPEKEPMAIGQEKVSGGKIKKQLVSEFEEFSDADIGFNTGDPDFEELGEEVCKGELVKPKEKKMKLKDEFKKIYPEEDLMWNPSDKTWRESWEATQVMLDLDLPRLTNPELDVKLMACDKMRFCQVMNCLKKRHFVEVAFTPAVYVGVQLTGFKKLTGFLFEGHSREKFRRTSQAKVHLIPHVKKAKSPEIFPIDIRTWFVVATSSKIEVMKCCELFFSEWLAAHLESLVAGVSVSIIQSISKGFEEDKMAMRYLKKFLVEKLKIYMPDMPGEQPHDWDGLQTQKLFDFALRFEERAFMKGGSNKQDKTSDEKLCLQGVASSSSCGTKKLPRAATPIIGKLIWSREAAAGKLVAPREEFPAKRKNAPPVNPLVKPKVPKLSGVSTEIEKSEESGPEAVVSEPAK